ncbi:hypothetical protein TSUD_359790 [Trifolium subterraneum]|uniref:Cyanobacterial aminoacyl-tRNA synthetase CAAD domain-containing protein n=1 Tax=Trifolium subterraneum TaxID=3900 RepID=A0A2Z6NPR9_TRISU|nr:hypothetical protein TSUD_359790 [Trifolium subterraneum]
MVMATGDAPAETDVPEFVKSLQDAWDKVDDKYAVGSLVVASVIALWGSTGLISWFAYKNLVFKPEREELVQKYSVEDFIMIHFVAISFLTKPYPL